MHFVPCYLGSKGLQRACNKLELKHSGGGSFREALIHPRVGNLQSLLLFYVIPAKKQQSIKIKCAQTHLKSVLGHHANYQKETK